MADIIDLLGSLKWANPIIWPNCGKAEPPDNLKRDGMLVFADGVNWDPGQGKGYYYWDAATSAWVKIGTGTPSSHSHTESDLNLSDVTTGNVSAAKHGFCPKLPNDGSKFLDGTGSWSAVGDILEFVYDPDYQCLVVE